MEIRLKDDRPIMLDLFCCAGGAAVGYHRAGFRVIGFDIDPQRNFPFEFRQADAIQILEDLVTLGPMWDGRPVAAVHASPPCQRYSAMSKCRPEIAEKYPDLVAPVRELLAQLPECLTVIENVPGAPLRKDLELCGTMFDRELYRHRIFETNFVVGQPEHPEHLIPASKAGHWKPGTIMSVSGHIAPIAHARKIMDIDWTNRHELAESIPPYYTQYIGEQILAHLKEREAA